MPMTVTSACRKMLRTRLLALSGVPATLTVLWQGEPKDTPLGALHAREAMRIAQGGAEVVTLGTPGASGQRLRVLYELDIYAPFPKLGTAQGTPVSTVADPMRVAESWADTVAHHFRPGITMTAEGRSLVVDRATAGEARPEGAGFVMAPVRVFASLDFTSAI